MMKPGVNNSERVLKYYEIDIDTIDLIDDAWGFKNQFPDVMLFLSKSEPKPSEALLDRLFSRVESGR